MASMMALPIAGLPTCRSGTNASPAATADAGAASPVAWQIRDYADGNNLGPGGRGSGGLTARGSPRLRIDFGLTDRVGVHGRMQSIAHIGRRGQSPLAPSPGTPGEGWGEGDFRTSSDFRTVEITLILTFSRRTGRRDRSD